MTLFYRDLLRQNTRTETFEISSLIKQLHLKIEVGVINDFLTSFNIKLKAGANVVDTIAQDAKEILMAKRAPQQAAEDIHEDMHQELLALLKNFSSNSKENLNQLKQTRGEALTLIASDCVKYVGDNDRQQFRLLSQYAISAIAESYYLIVLNILNCLLKNDKDMSAVRYNINVMIRELLTIRDDPEAIHAMTSLSVLLYGHPGAQLKYLHQKDLDAGVIPFLDTLVDMMFLSEDPVVMPQNKTKVNTSIGAKL